MAIVKRTKRMISGRQQPLGKVQLFKIAPGEKARFWNDCLKGGYICVGWDEVGDLTKFESRSAFISAFKRKCSYSPSWKWKELWTLRDLKIGDKVIANDGLMRVVGVGTVKAPGYRWMPNRSPDGYSHTVAVHWDKSSWGKSGYIQLPRQPWNNTVKPVSRQLFESVSGHNIPPGTVVTEKALREKRKKLLRLVKQRQGQQRFRDELLRAYKNRCAVSNTDVAGALEAAHIDPEMSAVPSNGILLRADLHSLFDLQLMGLDPLAMRVRIRPDLKGSEYWRFHNRKIRLPDDAHLRPDKSLLADRYRLFQSS